MLLVVVLALAACRPGQPVPDPRDCHDCSLLLISIDTLRADHLGTYGYSVATSPEIDDWASRSVVFERAYSTAEKTADSHMSIFTGLHPSTHRILNSGGTSHALRLGDSIETLAEVLKEAGFATAGFHGGGNVEGFHGFDRGFDVYQGASKLFEHPTEKVDRAIGWLDERRGERFFLFFHTYSVHDPYIASREFADLSALMPNGPDPEEVRVLAEEGGFETVRERFWSGVKGDNPEDVARMVALYDALIRETDRFIARLIREVTAREPDTLVVFLSDHGEEFQEHGRFLHTQLYEEVIHVPLILKHPGVVAGKRIEEVVSLVGLAPTILDLLEQRPLKTAAGQSFARLLSADERTAHEPRSAYSEKLWLPPEEPGVPAVVGRSMVFADGAKIILKDQGGLEFYDLTRDPFEAVPVVDAEQVPAEKLEALAELARQTEALGAELYREQGAERVAVDEEVQSQLRALGYIE